MKRNKVALVLAAAMLLASCKASTPPAATPAAPAATPAAAATPEPATPAPTAEEKVKKTGFPITTESVTLNAMVSKDPNVPDWNTHPALKYMEELTGVKINWDCVPAAGFEEKRNLRFSSNDLPDFVIRAFLRPELETKYIASKQIVALDDLIKDYAPNFSKILADDPGIKRNIAQTDGKIYSLPQLNTTAGNLVQKYWINSVWLKELGLKMPTTMDEYYDVMVAFRDKDPNKNGKKDEIAYAGAAKTTPYNFYSKFLGAYGIGHNNGVISEIMDVDDSGKVRLFVTDDKFKEMITFFNKMWKEGLVDKESFSQDFNALIAKAAADQFGFATHGNNNQWLGTVRANYEAMPALAGPKGDKKWTDLVGFVQTTGTFVMTPANKYPEVTMRWVDHLYSEDGTVLVRMGIKDKSYYVTPEGKYELFDFILKDPNGLTLDQAICQWGLFGGGNIPQFIYDKVDKSAAQLPEVKAWTEMVLKDAVPYEKITNLKFPEQDSIKLTSYTNDIKAYINENIVKFITGTREMSTWDAYVNELNKMNIKEFLAIYQSAYDRWKEAK